MASPLRIWPTPPEPTARFEFRCWGKGVEEAHRGLDARWHRQAEIAGTDMYYLGGDPDLSLKARAGRFQAKECIGRQGALQQWRKSADLTFPLALDAVLPWLQRAFGMSAPAWTEGTMSQGELETWLHRQAGVTVASVEKRRVTYRLSVLSGEYAAVTADGRTAKTVAVESTDATAVDWAMRDLGIAEQPNEAYPAALMRLLGQAPDSAR